MKKINVFIKLQAHEESVEVINDIYYVKVRARPVDGQANERAIQLLADHFKVSKSKVLLLKGQKSRKKVFAINE